MTSPTVGQVQVELTASVSRLAKSIRDELQSSFKDLDLGKALRESLGTAKIKLPVEPDMDTNGLGDKVRRTRIPKIPVEPDLDTSSIPAKVRGTRVPKVPVELDPLLNAFQQQVRRDVASLARTLNASVPIGADTTGLRAELGAQLAAIKSRSRVEVPTEPGGKAEYEVKLKAQLAEVAARVKQHVKIDPDTGGAAGAIRKLFGGIANVLPNFAGISSGVSAVGDQLAKVVGSSAQLGGSLAGALSTAAGPAGVIIGLLAVAAAAMGALGAAAVLVVPAISAVAGAAAAIPGALTGVGAIFGTLSLGFKGISEAFKPKTARAGGGGANQAQQSRQIAAAERGVEAARRGIAGATRGLQAAERSYADAQQRVVDAQKKVVVAQEAVNKARKEAAADIDDLSRALRGAQLDEESAALGVTEALRALNEAKLTGNLPDILRADLAYRQAQLTLENAKDAAKDLGNESVDSAKKGVEGSDKVQAALQGQADAVKSVKDAQEGVLSAHDSLLSAQDALKSSSDGLKSAQDSLASAQQKVAAGSAAAAAKMIRLAPAAQSFVNALKALKPAFEGLRLDVQQRLFEGLDQTVRNLGKAWIPALKVTLGSYADTFNNFFKNLGTAVTQPKFITDLQIGAEGFRLGLEKIGTSITTALVPAFGALSAAAGPFLSRLGGEIAGIVTEFSHWVLQAEKSGKLKDFFTQAAIDLHEIFRTGKLVTDIIGKVITAITGGGAPSTGKSPLQSFNDALDRVNTYLADPAHQEQIKKFVDDLANGLVEFGVAASKVNEFLDKIGLGGTKKGHSAGEDIGRSIVSGIFAGIGLAMESLANFYIDNLLVGPVIGMIKRGFGIKSPSTVMIEVGKNLVRGLINGISDFLGNLGAKVGEIKTRVTNALARAGSWLYSHGQAVISGLGSGIVSGYHNVSIWAGNAKAYIQNALSKAGNFLYTHGRAVIDGLINGISSALGKLGSFLGDVGQFIKDHKGPIEKDRVLLVGAGRAIMDGLITGLDDRKGDLAAKLSDVSGLVSGTSFADLGVQADASLSRSLAVSSSNFVELRWAQGLTGDAILDALRGKIAGSYNGDPMRALATG